MLVERCAPLSVQGIDPSEGQLAYARAHATSPRRAVSSGRCHGAAVRRRHVRRGGHAAGDLLRSRPGQGRRRDGARGLPGWHVLPPTRGTCSAAVFPTTRCRLKCARWAWPFRYRRVPTRRESTHCGSCGSARVWMPSKRGRSAVQRTFADFDDYWTTILGGASVGPKLAAMSSADLRASQGATARAAAGRCHGPYHLQCACERGEGSRTRLIGQGCCLWHRADGREPSAPQFLADLRSERPSRSVALRATRALAASAARR